MQRAKRKGELRAAGVMDEWDERKPEHAAAIAITGVSIAAGAVRRELRVEPAAEHLVVEIDGAQPLVLTPRRTDGGAVVVDTRPLGEGVTKTLQTGSLQPPPQACTFLA